MKTLLILILSLATAPALACDGTDKEIPACRTVKKNLAEFESKLKAAQATGDHEKVTKLVNQFLKENSNDLKLILHEGALTRQSAINYLKEFNQHPFDTPTSVTKKLMEFIDRDLGAANRYAEFINSEFIGRALVSYDNDAVGYLSGEMVNLNRFKITYDQAQKYVGGEANMARLVQGSEQANILTQTHVAELRGKAATAAVQADKIEGILKDSKLAKSPGTTWNKIIQMGRAVK